MSGDSISSGAAAQVGANNDGANNGGTGNDDTGNDDTNKDGAGYAGDLSVDETWALLRDDAGAVLVDVRTPAEWSFVGVVDLSGLGKEARYVPWMNLPGLVLNADFVDQIKDQNVARDVPVCLLCRSGVRSKAAAIALTAAGFGPCYNIAGGFEGDLDDHKHRGLTGGWKVAGLSWVQS
jgi:rhodanese-related sulfurtransferase